MAYYAVYSLGIENAKQQEELHCCGALLCENSRGNTFNLFFKPPIKCQTDGNTCKVCDKTKVKATSCEVQVEYLYKVYVDGDVEKSTFAITHDAKKHKHVKYHPIHFTQTVKEQLGEKVKEDHQKTTGAALSSIDR
ncbi:hypothetical protein [Parasitella parasitica]|uniref:Uncharacterized protein n=1 Tax=Parasitella parasitica TaxID=35722 RepID=A0A0B7MVE7_9FUNG|nr:hypothetical protein [Parasitella parasitica]